MRRIVVVFCLLFSLVFPCYASSGLDGGTQVLESMQGEKVARKALEEVIATYEDARRHELELVYSPRDFRVPEGSVTFVAEVPFGIRYGSTTAVTVEVSVNNKPFRKLSYNYRIHVFDTVVVATRNLQPRRILEEVDVRLEERDVSGINKKYLTRIEDVIGRETNRLVKAGTIFTQRMVVNPVIITPGTQILIVAEVNGVRVSAEGVAMDRGREGGMIRVKNILTGKVIRGKVIDSKTVLVGMGSR